MTETFSHRTTTISGGSDGTQTRERVVAVEVDGRSFDVRLHTTEPPWAALGRRRRERSAAGGAAGSGAVTSPMQGTLLKVLVAEGDTVTAGQVICVVEAMKMENEIAAPRDGAVTELDVTAGQSISSGQLICVVASG
jgi:acetyl-CoA/propionyl-CoA carboxylase biotin carboxyl carrier protein